MPKYKCCFQDSYLDDESFKVWLKKDEKDINIAFCKVCCKSFSTGNGSTDNLKQHAKGKRHEARYPVPGRTISFNKSPKKGNIRKKKQFKSKQFD